MSHTQRKFLVFLIHVLIFLASFLLFQIQPLITKQLLPYFGGAAPVWTTALVFFTGFLVLGYLYAYFVTRERKRLIMHVVVVLLGLVYSLRIMSIGFENVVASVITHDIFAQFPQIVVILATLFVALSPLYLLLASTSTTLQHWYTHVAPGKNPYTLYALSNTGSLFGLLSYPFIVEPLFELGTQQYMWIIGIVLFLVLLGLFIVIYRKTIITMDVNSHSLARNLTYRSVKARTKLIWLGLAIIPTMLLTAGTLQTTQEIASFPLLWIIPLAGYLISFIFAFSKRKMRFSVLVLAVLGFLFAYIVTLPHGLSTSIVLRVFAVNSALFLLSYVIHRKLYDIRPEAKSLTLFYVFVALGGSIGTLMVSIVFPLVFTTFVDFSLTLLLAGLVPMYLVLKRFVLLPRRHLALLSILFAVGIGGTSLWVFSDPSLHDRILTQRNFYGVQYLYEDTTPDRVLRIVKHGTTIHGLQIIEPAEYQLSPASYYKVESGLGQGIIQYFNTRADDSLPARMHVVGLGAGAVAAYCHKYPMDIVFYEINPLMISWARDQFTFIDSCPNPVTIIERDGRLGIGEHTGAPIDLLVLDAFNDDSIPAHLLTREAFLLYGQQLADNGMILINISNRHLDLFPLIASIARERGMNSVSVLNTDSQQSIDTVASQWVIVTRENLDSYGSQQGITVHHEPVKYIKPWTDGYVNIFPLLKVFLKIHE